MYKYVHKHVYPYTHTQLTLPYLVTYKKGFNILFTFYMYGHFAGTYVCVPCACLVPTEVEEVVGTPGA